MTGQSHVAKLQRLSAKQLAVSARELSAAGIPSRAISCMAVRGHVRRVGRGL